MSVTEQTRPAAAADGRSEESEKVLALLGGHIFFQILSSAVRIGLFDLLGKNGPLSRPRIQEELKLEAKPTRILLLGCTALKLIEKRGGGYANSPVKAELLTRASPRSLVPVVEWQHFINYKPMYRLYESLLENRNVGLQECEGMGKTLYERLSGTPDLEKIFQRAMQAISVQSNEALAAQVDFTGVELLVDVGVGNGTNLIALVRKYPLMRGKVFDFPDICRIAQENIRTAGFADRVEAVPGNCFQDPFPKGADAFLFAHFLTPCSEEKNRFLLRKAYEVLPSGGRAFVFNMMQSDDETGPLTPSARPISWPSRQGKECSTPGRNTKRG